MGRDLFKPDCEKIAHEGSQKYPSIQGGQQHTAPTGPVEVPPTSQILPSEQRKRDQAQKDSLQQRDESSAKRARVEEQAGRQTKAEGGKG